MPTGVYKRKHSPRKQPLSERFWEKVKKGKSCWVWTSSTSPKGYGLICITKELNKKRKRFAHRICWELVNGPIPEGLCVCHKCDNPPCVNPDHLFLATNHENRIDSAKKLRTNRNKLTPDDIKEMRRRHAKGGITYSDLAKEYGVNKSTIRRAVIGHVWNWI